MNHENSLQQFAEFLRLERSRYAPSCASPLRWACFSALHCSSPGCALKRRIFIVSSLAFLGGFSRFSHLGFLRSKGPQVQRFALLFAGLRLEEAYSYCFQFGFSGWGPRGGFPFFSTATPKVQRFGIPNEKKPGKTTQKIPAEK